MHVENVNFQLDETSFLKRLTYYDSVLNFVTEYNLVAYMSCK